MTPLNKHHHFFSTILCFCSRSPVVEYQNPTLGIAFMKGIEGHGFHRTPRHICFKNLSDLSQVSSKDENFRDLNWRYLPYIHTHTHIYIYIPCKGISQQHMAKNMAQNSSILGSLSPHGRGEVFPILWRNSPDTFHYKWMGWFVVGVSSKKLEGVPK